MRHLLLLCLPIWLVTTAAQANEDRYARICMNGDIAGQGTCPTQPRPGKQPAAWACTRDNQTNLVWSIENGKGSWHYAMEDYPKTTNKESRCGFSSGWRLPTRQELLTIMSDGDSSAVAKLQVLWKRDGINQSAIDARFFPETPADAYWTANSSVHDPSHAWFVYFKPGFDNASNAYMEFKSEVNYIRLVRDVRDSTR